MHYVYIILSERTGKFYIGKTLDLRERLNYHNDPGKNTNSTKSGIPWKIFWTLEVKDRVTARKIETHIKKMKSKKYLNDLTIYSEISLKLIEKYDI